MAKASIFQEIVLALQFYRDAWDRPLPGKSEEFIRGGRYALDQALGIIGEEEDYRPLTACEEANRRAKAELDECLAKDDGSFFDGTD